MTMLRVLSRVAVLCICSSSGAAWSLSVPDTIRLSNGYQTIDFHRTGGVERSFSEVGVFTTAPDPSTHTLYYLGLESGSTVKQINPATGPLVSSFTSPHRRPGCERRRPPCAEVTRLAA